MSVFPARILQDHDKPRFAEPCNNCGLCCRVQACNVSKGLLHSDQAPCIALEIHDGKFMCGMMIRPGHYLRRDSSMDDFYRPMIARLLDVGAGCGMPDEVVLIRSSDFEQARTSSDAVGEVQGGPDTTPTGRLPVLAHDDGPD